MQAVISGCLLCAIADERFEGNFAAREVADLQHEFRRHAVIRHLTDAAWRDAKQIRERLGSAALLFKPRL